MRPKVVVIVAALALFALSSVFVVRHRANAPSNISDPQPKNFETGQPSNATASRKSQSATDLSVASTNYGTQPVAAPEDAHQAYVDQRSAQLMDLAMTDDRGNLDTILSELSNRDPEIRKAALEATIQFGSRDAIPKLADAASQTDDPNEKAALADAIEFLKLPSLTEISSQSPRPAASQPVAKPHKVILGKRMLPTPPPTQ
jgi:hypothetical protein